MADLQALIRAVDELNADERQQLYEHIVEARMQANSELEETPDRSRILSLHAHLGQVWISDNFRDELPDSFGLGES